MSRRPLRYLAAAAFALTGCSALLDVKDIYFDPNADGGGGAGDAANEGSISPEGSTTNDSGVDAAPCVADTTSDPLNCGRCGHSCLGGTCTAGTCGAIELGSITDAPMYYVVASDQHVFASTAIGLTTQSGGVWRIAKTGGIPELYVNLRYAEAMAVVGDRLYFVVDDYKANGTNQTGGLYACPLLGAAPCTPKLIAAAESPAAIAVDNGQVFYGDNTAGQEGIMRYAPPAAPTLFRSGFAFPSTYFVDGASVFYGVTIFGPPQRAKVFEALADGGVNEVSFYESTSANSGRLIGNATSMLFTAYDYNGPTSGVVRRIPRTGGAPCDFGGGTNKRPYGVHADGSRVYWANQGEGAAAPYTKGSVVSCDQATCCTTPDVMWTGDGMPTAVTGDAEAIYFVTASKGAIWKVAKP